jgi:hypothetical protein
MAAVDVIWARAPTLEKLQQELLSLLDGYAPEDVISLSHAVGAVASTHSGGVWGRGREAHKVEYSAIVLVRGT